MREVGKCFNYYKYCIMYILRFILSVFIYLFIFFLVRLGWSHGDQEIFSMNEMLEFFNPTI